MWESETLIPILSLAVVLIFWVAWWLWAVDWRNLWPALAQGAWAPATLLAFIVAFAWSLAAPAEQTIADDLIVPNFYWQLGIVALFYALAGFCGWLQGRYGWQPEEIELHPAGAHTHGQHDQAHVAH